MKLTQIRDFLAVVECGGVRAAARKLGVAPPTLSKSVNDLETSLHVQLLARSARGVTLTSAGRAFHARAQAATTELRKAEEEAAQSGGSGAGTVTFSMGRNYSGSSETPSLIPTLLPRGEGLKNHSQRRFAFLPSPSGTRAHL